MVVGAEGEYFERYLNGEKLDLYPRSRIIGQTYQTSNSFRIGGESYYYKGEIDDVKIYNRALTAEEIATLNAELKKPATAYDREFITPVNTAIPLKLKAVDSNSQETLTYEIVTPPSNGSLTGEAPNLTYRSNTDFTGDDSFTFKVNDGYLDSNIATVSIKVAFPAFPGAEGFGITATGGRGGQVVHVTNLNDSGEGSLRWALTQVQGPRIIVFDVGGFIELKSTISVPVECSDYTLAGQTAPGGVTLSGSQLELAEYYGANPPAIINNFIVRHMRVRGLYNGAATGDPIGSSGDNFILDHVTVSGAEDESMGWMTYSDRKINYTVQWCTIEESALWSQGVFHSEGDHNKGFYQGYDDYAKLTFHHNLHAHHYERGPLINYSSETDGGTDFRNNVAYNVTLGSMLGSFNHFNVVNNVYVAGPQNPTAPYNVSSRGGYFYPRNLVGNVVFNTLNPDASPVNISAPTGVTYMDEPWFAPFVTTETAEDALLSVLDKAGAWPRDATTRRTMEEVRTRTGEMGVHGPIERLAERKDGPCSEMYDTDRDGMPNDWELSRGLNPSDPEDRNNIVPQGASPDDRHKGYTYIEYYMNELADNVVGQSGTTFIIETNVAPVDSGAVVSEHSIYGYEPYSSRWGGYNAPYEFGKSEFKKEEYNEGSTVIMKAKPRPGYEFSHWEGEPVNGLTSTQISFPATSNVNITAHFVPLSKYNITVSISPENAGNVAGSGEYDGKDTVTLAAYSNEGYVFKQWTGGPLNGVTNPVIQFRASGDVTLTAEFEPGEGGDFLIDDFDDQDRNSYLLDPSGNPKPWGSRIKFKEFPSGSENYVSYGDYNNFSIGYRDGLGDTQIPEGTTVFKFRLYNLGDKPIYFPDFRIGSYQWKIRIPNSSQYWYAGPLYNGMNQAKPFRFPVVEPHSSSMVEIPISLIRDGKLNYVLKPESKFQYFWFVHLPGNLPETPYGDKAVDDVAFGRASAGLITAPNLAPVANAGRDQVAKDIDGDGKALVWLKGYDSYDQDAGLITSWVWTESGFEVAQGFAPSVKLPVGEHVLTLTVTDESGATSEDNVTIAVLEGGEVPGPHTLEVTIIGEGTVTKNPDLLTYEHGTPVQLTATPLNGYVFSGWSGDIIGTQNPVTITIYSSKSITANFEQGTALEGDLNGDNRVDIFDLYIVAQAFGSGPGDTNWDSRADLKNDSYIDIFDLFIVASNFGKGVE